MINIFVLIIALAVLIFGANKFVDASSNYAAYFGVNEFFIGLTIVALGTSIPELFVAVSAIFNRLESVAIGTIVGSNIANIALIFGISCFSIASVKVKANFISLIPVALVVMLFAVTLQDQIISNIEVLGFILIFLFFIYALLQDKNNIDIETISTDFSKIREFMYLLMGFLFIVIGSNLTVIYAEKVAINLGVSELIIGLSILALGTSLPELATTITALSKGKNEMVVGNIIGSNVLNFVLVIPLLGISSNFMISNQLLDRDLVPLIISTAMFITLALILSKYVLSRWIGVMFGISFLTFYILYIASVSGIVEIF
ncbi:calcium:sodium antiporter [Pseudomonadota bacterium]|nr:calcium:sodium antiporter [Pseudomonadota bacterium]